MADLLFVAPGLSAEDCMKGVSIDNVLMASALLTFAVFLAWSVKIIAAGDLMDSF